MPAQTSRRSFVTGSALSLRVLGANDRIRMASIGTGPRGQYLMKELNRIGGVEWVGVCDVYSARRDQAATIAGGAVKTYNDHRQVLEHTDLDAVIVATPDHWHGPITVDALNAGKDVYVEKPMVHNPRDGQAVVRGARANRRIVQVGMQARAIPHWQQAREKYQESGVLGKVGLIRTWYNSNRGYVLKPPPDMERKPEGLDWDRWLGPGPRIPWNPDVYFSPYKWLHYDGGMIMGIGIHVIDSARQFAKLSRPRAVVAGGGIYHFPDRDTPDVVNLILEYPEGLNVTFEAEILTWGMPTSSAGIELRARGGILRVHRYIRDLGWEFTPNPDVSTEAPAKAPGDPPSAEHLLRNWLECLRTREKPIASEIEGYYSSIACFMGLEAYRQKKRIEWDRRWDIEA